MSENIGWKTLIRWVLIQLWEKGLKYFSDQNVPAIKKTGLGNPWSSKFKTEMGNYALGFYCYSFI